MLMLRYVSLCFLALLLAAPVAAQDFSGTLASDAPTRSNGSPYNVHTFDAEENEEVTVRLESPQEDFDTYLVVRAPNGETYENDDYDGFYISQVTFTAPASGEYEIWASSYSDDGAGDYVVSVDRLQYEVFKEESGRLDPEDEQLVKGEFYDSFSMEVPNGPFVVELRALGFDGYLRVVSPSGENWRNDDFDSTDAYRLSRIEGLNGDGGTWQIDVTSYGEGEVGAYDLLILTPSE